MLPYGSEEGAEGAGSVWELRVVPCSCCGLLGHEEPWGNVLKPVGERQGECRIYAGIGWEWDS